MTDRAQLTVFGCRGSFPVTEGSMSFYGGNTSCFLLRMGQREIILDGGTGLKKYAATVGEDHPRRLDILLSHLHFDHIQGLPFLPLFYCDDVLINIYGEPREGKSIKEQIFSFIRTPFFPVRVSEFKADVRYHDIKAGESFSLGDEITVRTMRSNHPNTCTLYRLDGCGASVCYALDYEHGPSDDELTAFADGCDLLIYDAHFLTDEYVAHQGWGHSTWQRGTAIAAAAHAGKLLLAHHAPEHDDELLRRQEALAQNSFAGAIMAAEGEEIDL